MNQWCGKLTNRQRLARNDEHLIIAGNVGRNRRMGKPSLLWKDRYVSAQPQPFAYFGSAGPGSQPARSRQKGRMTKATTQPVPRAARSDLACNNRTDRRLFFCHRSVSTLFKISSHDGRVEDSRPAHLLQITGFFTVYRHFSATSLPPSISVGLPTPRINFKPFVQSLKQ
jgi:hypothetical protein